MIDSALIVAVLAIVAIVTIILAPLRLQPLDLPPTDNGCTNGNPDCRFGARCGQCRGDNII